MARIYELRIHGVSNTPPEKVLARPPTYPVDDPVTAEDIVQVAGDELASFWQRKGAGEDDPPQVTPEAYSWGGLTSAPKATKRAVALLQRVGWLLLLPFALVNVAYWSRPRVRGEEHIRLGWPARTKGDRTARYGAGLFRVAALLLTALYVTAATQIGSDLVAWQCYRGRAVQCEALPSWLNFLSGYDPPRRIAVGAAVPLAVLAVLWFLSRQSMQRYEAVSGDDMRGTARHLLEAPGLWNGALRVLRLQRLHLAAGLGVLVVETAWPVWSMPSERHWVPLISGLCGAAVLVAATLLALAQVTDAPEFGPVAVRWARAPGVLLVIAIVITAGHLVVLWRGSLGVSDEARDLSGVGAAPLVLAFALAILVVAAFTLRLGWVTSAVTTLGLVAVGAGGYQWAHDESRERSVLLVAPALLLLAGWWWHRVLRGRGINRYQAWGGAAPAFLLGAAVMIALLFTTSASLLAADRLNGGAKVDELVHQYQPVPAPPTDPKEIDCEGTGTLSSAETTVTCKAAVKPKAALVVPILYFWTSLGLLAMLAAWLLVGLGLLCPLVRSSRGVVKTVEEEDYKPPLPSPSMPDTTGWGYQRARIAKARRFAWLAHRAERIAGLLGLTTCMALLVTLVAALGRRLPWEYEVGGRDLGRWVGQAALLASVGAALGVLALGAWAYKSPRARITLGVIWDLSSFWPRAAHPFAPPCYAERAVPDVTQRVAYRLRDEGDRVILSGHSLGSTLAVATYFRLSPAQRMRVSLVTYGSQLRAYFGRLFPEAYGSDVLGNAPATQLSLGAREPAGQRAPTPPRDTLAGELRVGDRSRWRNLYRRSDHLGFHVYDDTDDNSVDLYTPEARLPWEREGDPQPPAVETHSDYPRTDEYTGVIERMALGARTTRRR